jgi:hypothetical protein
MVWPYGRPLPGSIEEAAQKIERLLDLEEEQKARTRARPPKPRPAARGVDPAPMPRGGLLAHMLAPAAFPATFTRTALGGPIAGEPEPGPRPIPVVDADTLEHCTRLYEQCVEGDWGGDWTCGDCHFFCTGNNGYWPSNRCSPSLPKRKRRPSPFDLPPPIILPPIPRPGGGGGKRPLPYQQGLDPLLM